MPSTRSQKSINSNNTSRGSKATSKKPVRKKATTKSNTTSRPTAPNTQSEDDDADEIRETEENNESTRTTTNEGSKSKKDSTPKVFRSRFPGFELDTFEDVLDDWTLITLREAIVNQASRWNSVPKDIRNLVKIVRLEFEKRILMIALMAEVPEVVIWNLV
jgi:hypothetical protein